MTEQRRTRRKKPPMSDEKFAEVSAIVGIIIAAVVLIALMTLTSLQDICLTAMIDNPGYTC